MDKIERSAHYYQLMIDKFEKSGRSPNQAQVYKEVKELVLQCASYEEIQNRMKNEGYYEKPGVALFMDKIGSLRDAATANGFAEVAAIYQKKYDEVKADGSQMFVTGYEQGVTAYLAKKGSVMTHVTALFQHYLEYLNRSIYDDPNKYIDKIRESSKGIEGHGVSLLDALNDPYNRAHILLEELAFSKFVATIEKIKAGSIQDDFQKQELDSKFEKAWEVLKPLKSKLGEISKSEDGRSKRVVFLTLPGDKLGDDYKFVERREETN